MCDNDEDYDGNAMFTMMTIKTTCSPDGSVAPGITAGSLNILMFMIKLIKIKMIMIRIIKVKMKEWYWYWHCYHESSIGIGTIRMVLVLESLP